MEYKKLQALKKDLSVKKKTLTRQRKSRGDTIDFVI